jgi:hypothetical protein
MRRASALIVAFVAGAITALAGATYAAALVGDNGYLIGWDVTIDGETVCSDPFVWTSTHEIDC